MNFCEIKLVGKTLFNNTIIFKNDALIGAWYFYWHEITHSMTRIKLRHETNFETQHKHIVYYTLTCILSGI